MPETAPASAPPVKKLGEILVDAGLITPEQLSQAVEDARQQQKRLGDYLQDEGLVAAEDVALALSLQLNLPIIDLTRHAVQPEALALVPEEYARQHDLIPVDLTGDSLVVVMADPLNMHTLEDLRARARKIIQPAVGIPSDIREAINRNYVGWNEIERQISMVTPRVEEAPAEDAATDLTAQTPIVRTAELIIAQAVRDRASDIHLEPKEDHLRVRYRIDGFLH